MTRQLNIAGKNSNEIYTLFYPNNLINFCRYDFSLFLEHCTDLCRIAARSGEFNVEDVYSIRNSISGCHKYYEQNMRGVFEKIVIDCWIEYILQQSNVKKTSVLWQEFMRCRNDFERAIFSRLSDYRYNRAINEWNNLLKMQEYARVKTDFVYGLPLSEPQEAVARANYFDLVFNVAANELGFPLEEIAATNVFSMGRLPNSPFIMSNAAHEIVRNQLNGLPYIEGGYKSKRNPDLTDKTAMDAFAAIRDFIPSKNDIMAKNIIRSITGSPQSIYMPCSFKAMIDLEIDMIAESGGILQKCAGCGEYYLKDENYAYDYCDRLRKDGLTCLEFAEKNNELLVTASVSAATERPVITAADDDDFEIIYVDKSVLTEKTDQLYKEMAARVNVDMTQRDFSNWYQKELRLKEQVILGEAGEKELNEFIELSRGDHFATKRQTEPREERSSATGDDSEPAELTENGKEIKKFVFERVERKQEPAAPQAAEAPTAPTAANVSAAAPTTTLKQSEQAAMDAVKRLVADKSVQQTQAAPAQAVQAATAPVSASVPAQTGYRQPAQPTQQPAQAVQPVQPVQAVQPVQPSYRQPTQPSYQQPAPYAYPTAQQSPYSYGQYGSAYRQPSYQQPAYPSYPSTYGQTGAAAAPASQQPRASSRVIRGGTPSAQEYTPKSKTVVIPNDIQQKEAPPPAPEPQPVFTPEPDVKVFNPKKSTRASEEDSERSAPRSAARLKDRASASDIFKSKQSRGYIEPTPYERMKEEYMRAAQDDEDDEDDDINVEGQMSVDDIEPAPRTVSKAGAISAYRSMGSQQTNQAERADFSQVLDSMRRDDGFARDEVELDPDGMPVTHKTKHVMDAIFSAPKVSPFLRISLDDDDE